MADTNASEAGRALVAHRWGNQAVLKAAEVVISRAAELPADVLAEVRAATGQREEGT